MLVGVFVLNMLEKFPDVVSNLRRIAKSGRARPSDFILPRSQNISGYRFWLICLENNLRLPRETGGMVQDITKEPDTAEATFLLYRLLVKACFSCDLYLDTDPRSIDIFLPGLCPAVVFLKEFKGERQVSLDCRSRVNASYPCTDDGLATFFLELNKLTKHDITT